MAVAHGGLEPPLETRRVEAPMSFNDISIDDLTKGLADGSVLLVDVREADEYTAGHIPGALFNPLSKFDPSKLPVATEGKRVVIYCRSGRRSVTAMEQARLAGRRDVNTHFGGGILAWLNAQQPVETGL
jgi:rhodanese-related sulfurtransferase